MARPSFLYQDSSWRTVVIEWSDQFNTKLSRMTAEQAPPLSNPSISPNLDAVRAANDNSLRLLDSRQIDANGKLPRHICGIAFGGWVDAEDALLAMHRSLSESFQDTDNDRLASNLMIAWIGLLRFNLANLSMVDGTTPEIMRRGAQESIDQARQLLEDAKQFEPTVSAVLSNLPSPTQHVRQAMDFALSLR